MGPAHWERLGALSAVPWVRPRRKNALVRPIIAWTTPPPHPLKKCSYFLCLVNRGERGRVPRVPERPAGGSKAWPRPAWMRPRAHRLEGPQDRQHSRAPAPPNSPFSVLLLQGVGLTLYCVSGSQRTTSSRREWRELAPHAVSRGSLSQYGPPQLFGSN